MYILSWRHAKGMIFLQIWDTAGEDQADLLDSSFWSNASGAVIVCNLHSADCISSLTFWQSKLQQVQMCSADTLTSVACDPSATATKTLVSAQICYVMLLTWISKDSFQNVLRELVSCMSAGSSCCKTLTWCCCAGGLWAANCCSWFKA